MNRPGRKERAEFESLARAALGKRDTIPKPKKPAVDTMRLKRDADSDYRAVGDLAKAAARTSSPSAERVLMREASAAERRGSARMDSVARARARTATGAALTEAEHRRLRGNK